MACFATADFHLGEDRFEIMQRFGFKSPQHMVDHFVELHNELVKPEDTVYMVGDVVNQNTPEFLPQIDRFNGRKILLRGNHDRNLSDADLEVYFDQIIGEQDGLEFSVGDIKCWMTHHPTQARSDRFNLVGHIHSAWKVQLNALNVGVDANHYYPHDIDKAVPFYFRAISQFYDQDVWVAYDESNNQFVGKRGAQSRYLDKE